MIDLSKISYRAAVIDESGNQYTKYQYQKSPDTHLFFLMAAIKRALCPQRFVVWCWLGNGTKTYAGEDRCRMRRASDSMLETDRSSTAKGACERAP